MKIKINELVEGCMPVRTEDEKSECFDLILSEDITLKKGEIYIAKLGIAAEIPKGMYARVYSRSSLPKKFNVTVINGVGIIDNSYKGDTDEWKCPLYALKNTFIPKGTRICQFEICLSQFASSLSKIKWIFNNKVELIKVSSLNNNSRGGIGSTGDK